MSPLVLVPCTSSKTQPAADGLRGRALQALAPDQQSSTWSSRVAEARPRVPVRSLYKGGAWALAREAAAAARRRGGAAYVVSAGLGLAAFEAPAPGYDITFTAGSPDLIPGRAPRRRARAGGARWPGPSRWSRPATAAPMRSCWSRCLRPTWRRSRPASSR